MCSLTVIFYARWITHILKQYWLGRRGKNWEMQSLTCNLSVFTEKLWAFQDNLETNCIHANTIAAICAMTRRTGSIAGKTYPNLQRSQEKSWVAGWWWWAGRGLGSILTASSTMALLQGDTLSPKPELFLLHNKEKLNLKVHTRNCNSDRSQIRSNFNCNVSNDMTNYGNWRAWYCNLHCISLNHRHWLSAVFLCYTVSLFYHTRY